MAWPFTFYKVSTVLLLTTLAQAANPKPVPVEFKTDRLKVDGKMIEVELAENEIQRERGLMFRDQMPENHGMLFVFNSEQTLNFWMKNTFIDLSIGYYDATQTLRDIQEMAKMKSVMEQNPPSYPSSAPAQFALEMNKGWFAKNKIKIGSRFEFISGKAAAKTKPGSKSKSQTRQTTK